MNKIIIIMLVTIFTFTACTAIPADSETGVRPGEMENKDTNSSNKSEEVKDDASEKLKEKLDKTESELKKLKEDLKDINFDKNEVSKELEETKKQMQYLKDGNNEFPKLESDAETNDDISKYLENLNSSFGIESKSITIIPQNKDDIIIFDAEGYKNGYNQILVWEVGKDQPKEIDDAYYGKGGGLKWLLNNKYLLLDTGKGPTREKKIIDVEKKNVVSIFETDSNDIYLIPNTTNILIQRAIDSQDIKKGLEYMIYDFLTGEQKTIEILKGSKNLKLTIDEETKEMTFSSTYIDDNGAKYISDVYISVDNFIKMHNIKSQEESENEKYPLVTTPEDIEKGEDTKNTDTQEKKIDETGSDGI